MSVKIFLCLLLSIFFIFIFDVALWIGAFVLPGLSVWYKIPFSPDLHMAPSFSSKSLCKCYLLNEAQLATPFKTATHSPVPLFFIILLLFPKAHYQLLMHEIIPLFVGCIVNCLFFPLEYDLQVSEIFVYSFHWNISITLYSIKHV